MHLVHQDQLDFGTPEDDSLEDGTRVQLEPLQADCSNNWSETHRKCMVGMEVPGDMREPSASHSGGSGDSAEVLSIWGSPFLDCRCLFLLGMPDKHQQNPYGMFGSMD